MLADFGEGDARQGVNEREVTAIASRVKRRGGLRDVLAHDGGVADLAVALAQLVVGKTDGAGVVRNLRLFERAAMERDSAGLVPTQRRQASMQAPERRETARGGGIGQRVGRAADRVRLPLAV